MGRAGALFAIVGAGVLALVAVAFWVVMPLVSYLGAIIRLAHVGN